MKYQHKIKLYFPPYCMVFVFSLLISFTLFGCQSAKRDFVTTDEELNDTIVNAETNFDSNFRNNKNIDTENFTMLSDYEGIIRSNDPEILKRNLQIFATRDERVNLILENFENLSKGMQILAGNNPMAIGSTLEILEGKQNFDWWGLSGSSLETDSPVTMYLQWDRRWANEQYGESSMAESGCAPTCLAMIFDTLKILPVTPESVAGYVNPEDISQEGTTWAFIDRIGTEFHVQSDRIAYDETVLKNELDGGNYILASLGSGTFTYGGHFIVIAGYDSDGFIINDPNSYENSIRHWDFKDISPVLELWSFGK